MNNKTEEKSYKDKNLTEITIKEPMKVKIITHGNFEQCKIIDLEISDIDGNVMRYNYWNSYNKLTK